MREILLSHNKITLVDDHNYDWLNEWKWSARKDGNKYYAVTLSHVLMHRIIMDNPKGMDVHHADSNGLNNQESNLVILTHNEHMRIPRKQYTRKLKHNKVSYSGTTKITNGLINPYKGVTWHKQRKMYYAYIYVSGKQKSLGLYEDINEAAIAYNTAVIENLDEKAKLNVIYSIDEINEMQRIATLK